MTGGVIAGIGGGIALLITMLIQASLAGEGVWPVVKGAALPFFGARVFELGFDAWPVLFGLAIHFVVAIGWGVAFAVLAYGLSHVATLAASLGWGLVVWFGMTWIVLPLIGWGEVARAMPIGITLFNHLVFGVVVGILFLPFQSPYRLGVPHPT